MLEVCKNALRVRTENRMYYHISIRKINSKHFVSQDFMETIICLILGPKHIGEQINNRLKINSNPKSYPRYRCSRLHPSAYN